MNPRLQWVLLMVQSGPWFQSNCWSLCSWRSLSGGSAIPGVVWACSHGDCFLGAVSAEVAALGLLWKRWLVPACSSRYYIASSGLLPQRLLIHAQSDIGLWFGAAPSTVAPCTCSCGGCCLRPALSH